jgi:hypothetical protein
MIFIVPNAILAAHLVTVSAIASAFMWSLVCLSLPRT